MSWFSLLLHTVACSPLVVWQRDLRKLPLLPLTAPGFPLIGPWWAGIRQLDQLLELHQKKRKTKQNKTNQPTNTPKCDPKSDRDKSLKLKLPRVWVSCSLWGAVATPTVSRAPIQTLEHVCGQLILESTPASGWILRTWIPFELEALCAWYRWCVNAAVSTGDEGCEDMCSCGTDCKSPSPRMS